MYYNCINNKLSCTENNIFNYMLYDSQVLKYLRDCNSELERLKQKKLKEERGKRFDVYTLYNQITDHLFYITE